MTEADEIDLSALNRATQEERAERDAEVKEKTELTDRLATSLAARRVTAPDPKAE
ncbi:MAG: hypothetical protein M3O28_15485 [Actinomycetota bacterium]|nr:hypothetical protein [Actinomycetota bacterium]